MTRFLVPVAVAVMCGCGPRVHPAFDRSVAGPPESHPVETASAKIETPAVRGPAAQVDEAPSREEAPPRIPRQLAAVIEETNRRLEDAFFPYDRSDAGADAIAALKRDSQILIPVLADFPIVKVAVEGHCDERGSAEYNLALGDRRATQAIAVLQQFGVRAPALTPISFGKEAPQCTESTESCWSRNRRVHLVLRPPV